MLRKSGARGRWNKATTEACAQRYNFESNGPWENEAFDRWSRMLSSGNKVMVPVEIGAEGAIRLPSGHAFGCHRGSSA